MCRGRKTAFNVAVSDVVFRRQIIRAIEPRARRIGFQSFIRVGDGRQFVVIDFDQGRGVFRRAAIVSHHKRNRLADIASFVVDKTTRLGVEFHRRRGKRQRNAVAGQKRSQIRI